MAKTKPKIRFVPQALDLEGKEVSVSTIAMFQRKFDYLKRYAETYNDKIPDDCGEIHRFWMAVKKLSNSGFRVPRFVQLWDEHHMTEHTDFKAVAGDGSSEKAAEELDGFY